MDKQEFSKQWEAAGNVEHLARVTPETLNAEDRTVDIVWFTGVDIPRYSWSEGPYMLRFDPKGADLSLLNSGAPVLDNHDSYSGAEGQKGVVMKAWQDGGDWKATLRFSKRPEVDGLWRDIEDKIVQKFSMGVQLLEMTDVRDKDGQLQMRTATKWQPFELSIAPIPADFGTTTLSAKPETETTLAAPAPAPAEAETQGLTAQKGEVSNMNENLNSTGAAEAVAQPAINQEALKAEAVTAERLRASTIRDRVGKAKLSAEFANGLIESGVSVEAASAAIFEELAKAPKDEPKQVPHVQFGADERDKVRGGMESAILYRANPGNAEYRKFGREFAGMTLFEMAKDSLRRVGVNTEGMARHEYVELAFKGHYAERLGGMAGTSDFPNILANVANKSLRQAYELAPRTFMPFCRQVSAADFKPVNRVQLSDMAAMAKVAENGEFTRTYLSDSKETYSLATYGFVVPITRQVVINDDLNALARIPAGIGNAAAALESDTVWGVITTNGNMADGTALFVAGHSNLNASTPLAAAGLTTARTKMRLQKGPKGNVLNLTPKFLIIPAALETTALQLIAPTQLAATAVTSVIPNWVASMVPVVEPRLDAVPSTGPTTWFVAADPSSIDTIEYCYLEGEQGVYIETRQGFDVDGIEIKARLDFAAAAIDHRGMQKNTA